MFLIRNVHQIYRYFILKNIDSAIVYFTVFLFGLHTAYYIKKIYFKEG